MAVTLAAYFHPNDETSDTVFKTKQTEAKYLVDIDSQAKIWQLTATQLRKVLNNVISKKPPGLD